MDEIQSKEEIASGGEAMSKDQVGGRSDSLYLIMVYGADLFLGSRSREHECFEVGEEVVVPGVHLGPKQLQDCPKDQYEELIEVNLGVEGKEAQPTFISARLCADLKQALLDFLKEFKVLFAWTYAETPFINPHLVIDQFNIREGTRPVK